MIIASKKNEDFLNRYPKKVKIILRFSGILEACWKK
jgi:hypothetical protein